MSVEEFSSDRITRRLGRGNAGEVFEATIDGATRALKVYVDPDTQETEQAAYTETIDVTSLKGRIAAFHGEYPRVQQILEAVDRKKHCAFVYVERGLVLDRLAGPTLDKFMDDTLSVSVSVSQCHDIYEQLKETLRILHDEVGLSHGSVHGRNVIMVDGRPVLVDFNRGCLRRVMSGLGWRQALQTDFEQLEELHQEMLDAVEEASGTGDSSSAGK